MAENGRLPASELAPIIASATALQWRKRFDAAGVPSEISVDTRDGETVLFDDELLRLGIVSENEHADHGPGKAHAVRSRIAEQAAQR